MSATSDSVDVCFTNLRAVEIFEGSAEDAENCLCDVWVNGECMAYTGSELIGYNTYRLTGLLRGRYGTRKAAHGENSAFAVLDDAIFYMSLPKTLKDKTVYLKFLSFNTFGNEQQQLDDVPYYSHLARMDDMPNVSGLQADVTRKATQDAGETVYSWDVAVSWVAPDWGDYSGGRVSYRLSDAQAWTYAGVGGNSLTIRDIKTEGEYVIAVATKDLKGNYETPDASTQVTITLTKE